jgi:sugar phosphate isomerase/epimerase
MNQPIAVQSWCYRHFNALPELLTQIKATGVSATELCGVHAIFTDPASAQGVMEQLQKANVSLVSIGVEALTGDAGTDRPRFEWCKAAGVKNMSITFPPAALYDGLKNIDKMAEQYDMKLGIHNHGGYDWLGNKTILKHVFSKTSERIGLFMDTAWALAARQDPINWVTEFAPRMYGLHVKDFVFDRAGKPADVIIGSGNLDLPKLVAGLKQIKFSGPLVIEYEGDVENPVPALVQCVQKLKALV